MRIDELMTRPAVTCRVADRLHTAAQLMWEHDCGAIPVVDDQGTLAGIITDRDICMAAYTQGAPLASIPVSTAMARQVFSCHQGDSLEAVEQLMSDKQVRRVPVVDDARRPVGMVALNDLVRHAGRIGKRNGVEHEVVRTLAAISQPRPQAASPSLRGVAQLGSSFL